ncbi:hypothetical protein ACFL58_03575 [Elusimicrobiota bacterium]
MLKNFGLFTDSEIPKKYLKGQRRRFFGLFKRREVKERLKKRRGECLRCGRCCRIVVKCPFLKIDENQKSSCRIHFVRPYHCRNYPFDLADSEIEGCGYYFIKES